VIINPNNRRVVDDTKVSDHHAIIPTTEKPGSLSAVEAKVYGLIMRRFLAQFYPDARYMDTEVITRVGALPDRFRSRGRRTLEAGWRVVEPAPAPSRTKSKEEDSEEDAKAPLPALKALEPVVTKTVAAEQKQTQPPRRYSEAALLGAMETAGKAMDDEALREAMKGHGLGTPATRAAIIERLKDVGYIALEKKSLVPTEKGHKLVQLAETAGASVLLSAELTGEWEKHIADIQAGAYPAERFMAEIQGMAVQVVEHVKKAAAGAVAATPARRRTAATAAAEAPEAADALPAFAGQCPRCGRAVVKGSREWKCANADCTLRIPTWLCGKVIDETMAAALMEKGRTRLIAGFKSPRTGKTFSAYLLLKDGQVSFEFPPDKPRKASGYRRNSAGGTAGESETKPKTGSRKTGSRTAGTAATGRKRTGSAGVGGGTSRTPKPAGTGRRGS
jgi:DNA topoisomerase-3